MEKLIEKFEENYLLGCIKYTDQYALHLMPIAWWILNHKKYNSGYDPAKWKSVFRNNILNVSDSEIGAYLDSIKEDKLNIKDLELIFNVPIEYRYLFFFVDFDQKIFVNGFPDIALEDYLPDQTWKGVAGDPIYYLPPELKKIIDPWQSENVD